MIQRDDIDAMAIYNDSTGYWTGDNDNHYATPMEMVKYFKEFTGQDGTPQLYSRLIMEEYGEWVQELLQINGDRTSELKELADLVYVIYGYALSKGWNLDEALYRVHVNNVLRVTQPDGTIKRREDGKIMKREDAPKVRLEDLV
jgi:NTP pyrophosphatase (non-canonical NTP hydrolase)